MKGLQQVRALEGQLLPVISQNLNRSRDPKHVLLGTITQSAR